MSIDHEQTAGGPDGMVVLRPSGCLDDEAGRQLIGATRAAAAAATRRIEIILDGLDSFTAGGIAALSACARLHDRVPDGIGLLASGGVGRQALLATFQPADRAGD